MFWRVKVRTHLHNTASKLHKELMSSARMHELFLINGSLDSSPTQTELQKGVISYTYKLTKPISVAKADHKALLFPGWIYREFQITVEKEQGAWVVSGESFVGVEK